MAFTVSRNDGRTKDAEFEAYTRLLRQQGVDLGKMPRVPEPGTGRRWLYVWDSREKAQAFAAELKKRTRAKGWAVVEVAAPPSEGPMGPILIQVGRRATGLVFGLHSLSRAMIQSAFPNAKGTVATVSIHFDTFQDFLTIHGSLEALAREVVPTLTGLKLHELENVGERLCSCNPATLFNPEAFLDLVRRSGLRQQQVTQKNRIPLQPPMANRRGKAVLAEVGFPRH